MSHNTKYLPLTRGWDDKAKERAVEHFEPKERRDEFFQFFRQLQGVYDVLSPDAFLRPYLDDYEALAALYALVREAYSPRIYVDRELTDKTRALLREKTALYNLEQPGKIHELGPKELEALRDDGTSDTVKVLNLRRVLAKAVDEQGASQPFLISIGEQAETVAQLYEDRQLTTQQALAEFERLARQATEAAEERARMGVDANTYAIYVALGPYLAGITAEQASTLNASFARFPDYRWDAQQQSGLRAELYRALLPLVGQDKLIAAANALMKLQRV